MEGMAEVEVMVGAAAGAEEMAEVATAAARRRR
jgi:hypothetical protein